MHVDRQSPNSTYLYVCNVQVLYLSTKYTNSIDISSRFLRKIKMQLSVQRMYLSTYIFQRAQSIVLHYNEKSFCYILFKQSTSNIAGKINRVGTYLHFLCKREREKKRKNDNTYSEMKITCQPAFLLYIYYTGIHGKHFLWDSNFFFHIETFNFSFFISFFSLVLSLPFFLINFFFLCSRIEFSHVTF